MITSLRISLVAAAIVAAATFANAEEQPATPATGTPSTPTPAADEAKAGDPNETICKRQAITGTRVGKYHLCLTRKEWDEMARTSAQDTGRLQQQRDTTRPGPAGASN